MKWHLPTRLLGGLSEQCGGLSRVPAHTELDGRRLLLENDKHWWESRWRLITGACSTLGSRTWIFFQINRKLLASSPEGVMEAPLLHTQTHSPLTVERQAVTGVIFSCCISFMKGKNLDTRLLSLWVFLKIHENIPSAPNNFLWGSWNQVTQSVCLCLISKFPSYRFPLQTCSPLNQLRLGGCLKC